MTATPPTNEQRESKETGRIPLGKHMLMSTVALFMGAILTATSSFLLGVDDLVSPVHAQVSTPTATCTTLQQFSDTRTQLQCTFSADTEPTFLAAELNFPFHITRVLQASSPYSSALSSLYPVGIVSTNDRSTLVTTSLSWGDQARSAGFQAAPFDGLSYFVESDQSLRDISNILKAENIQVDFLSPNLSDPGNPLFDSLTFSTSLRLDNSLVLSGFLRHSSANILQFLRLAGACYLQTPDACIRKLIENL